MSLDPYGNQTGPNLQGQTPTYYHGGTSTGGAAANYGGSANAYNNTVAQQTANVNSAWNGNNQAIGGEQDALGLARSAAMGLQPSAAQIQLQQSFADAQHQQQAMAASARGPSGLAMGQYNAAANTGALQSQAAMQGAQLRAQEMAQARGEYLQGTQGMRGQDIQQALGQEGILQGTQKSQLGAQGNAAQLSYAQWLAQMQADQASTRNTEGMIGNLVGGAAGAAGLGVGLLGGMGGGDGSMDPVGTGGDAPSWNQYNAMLGNA